MKKFSDLKQDDMLLVQMDADNPAVVPKSKYDLQISQERPFRAWITAEFHVLFNENGILFLLKEAEEITFDAEHNEHCLKYKRGCICLKCKYDYCECCIAVDECPIYTCPHFMEDESHE